MKKLIFLIVLLFLGQVAWGQRNHQYTERLDSIVTNLGFKNPSKYVFRYDEEGRLTERISYCWSRGKWIDPEHRFYTYDESGRLIAVIENGIYGDQQEFPFRTKMEYDDQGNLVSQTFDRDFDNDGSWCLQGWRHLKYDAKGNLAFMTEFQESFHESKERARHEMEYDGKGRLITLREYETNNGKRLLKHLNQYIYDKKGYLRESIRVNGEPDVKDSRPDVIIRKDYDKQGRIVSTSRRMAGMLDEVCEEEYCYDSHGNLAKVESYSFLGEGEREHDWTIAFLYDQNMNASSVMGLSCPEVLEADDALKEGLNMSRKPLCVEKRYTNHDHLHEYTYYYYSPIEEPAQSVSLGMMDDAQRYEYMVKLAKEVVMNFGSDYYQEYKSPEISEQKVFSSDYEHPDFQKNVGRKYYVVTFSYDKTRTRLEWDYGAQVEIWEDSGEPKGVMFGHGLGLSFILKSYRELVRDVERYKMPYQSKPNRPENIFCDKKID